jgi:hypothetical protein
MSFVNDLFLLNDKLIIVKKGDNVAKSNHKKNPFVSKKDHNRSNLTNITNIKNQEIRKKPTTTTITKKPVLKPNVSPSHLNNEQQIAPNKEKKLPLELVTVPVPVPVKAVEEVKKNEDNALAKPLIKYSKEELMSFKNKADSWVPPKVSPIEIIAEYLASFDMKEKKSRERPPRMMWVPKVKKEIKLVIVLDNEDDEEEEDEEEEEKEEEKKEEKEKVANEEKEEKESTNTSKEEVQDDDSAPNVYHESDDKRLQTRQKQIDIGKNTPEYINYTSLISKEQRKRGNPLTPNKYQVCSKRSWDGQVRKWRRMIHKYDPTNI